VAKAISKENYFMLTSRATVAIERPARYGKQLAGHIAHKAQVDEVGDGWELHIGDGLGRVIPRDNALELEAEAESPEMLERIKATPRQPGVDEIRIPSERAFRTRERLRQQGVEIDATVHDQLLQLAAVLSPTPIPRALP
jgi:LDH2 family malate/lactate/ureidoglycolate dehydrogenase